MVKTAQEEVEDYKGQKLPDIAILLTEDDMRRAIQVLLDRVSAIEDLLGKQKK